MAMPCSACCEVGVLLVCRSSGFVPCVAAMSADGSRPASAQRFVNPTHGLRTRGPSMSSNCQNLGGRHMVYEEMQQHKQRMKNVRPMIDLSPPWSHNKGAAQPRPSSAARKLRTQVTAQRPPSAARPAAAPSPPCDDTRGASKEFDVATLQEEDREAYAAMLRVLCSISNTESRSLLEQLYRESEDRKLLAAYSGVFPKLEAERQA